MDKYWPKKREGLIDRLTILIKFPYRWSKFESCLKKVKKKSHLLKRKIKKDSHHKIKKKIDIINQP